MLVADFNTDFTEYVEREELQNANNVLLQKLAEILVTKTPSFIDMLNESGIEADSTMSHSQLIKLFVENTDNKKMLLGASLLANSFSDNSSFDAQPISNDGVKIAYATLNENFNGADGEVSEEDYSYIAVPALLGLVRGVNKLRKGRKESKLQDSLEKRRREAQIRMQKAAAERKRIELANAERKRKAKITYAVIGSVSLVAIIAVVIAVKRNK